MKNKTANNHVTKKLLNCIKIQNRFTFKSYWFYLVMALWIGILLMQVLIIMPENQEIGTSLTLSAYWVQILIFLGLFIGYYYGKNEFYNNCDEIIASLPNAYVLKQISKIINIIIIGLIIFITSTVAIMSYFFVNKVNAIYYFSSIKYIFLYWFLTFIISGILGIILGNVFYSKAVYFIIIFVGLLVGPICMDIIDPLLDQFHIILHPYFMAINLGQLDPHKGMNSLFGYEMQKELWIIRLILILCLCTVLIILFYRYEENKIKKKINTACTILILIMLTTSYIISFKYVKQHYYKYVMDDIEQKYGFQNNIKKDEKKFEIISSNIVMNTKGKISMIVKMNIKPNKDADKLNFILYQGFKIDSIKINGNNVSFIRKDDDITINQKFTKNEKFYIEMEYKGLPLNYLYQDTNAWMLPVNFAWMPFIGSGPAVIRNSNDIYDLSFNYIQQETPVNYEIIYIGSGNPICNLEIVGKNHWKGTSKSGISMVNGWIKEGYTDDGKRFYYPISYKKYDEYVPKMIKEFEKNQKIIYNDFNINKNDTSNVKTYLFLPNVYLRNDGIYNFDDHLILSINEAYSDGEFLIYPDVTMNWILQSTIYDKYWNDNQLSMQEYFTNSYITWYIKRFKDNYSNSMPITNMLKYKEGVYEKIGDKESADLCRKLNDFIMNNSDDKIKMFFINWLKMANSSSEINFNSLEKLMN